MIWPTWFEHLEESYSYKEVQLKKFCPPVKTSCPPAENVNDTPGNKTFKGGLSHTRNLMILQ